MTAEASPRSASASLRGGVFRRYCADIGRAALLTVVPVLAFAGGLRLWHLCLLSFAIGTLTVFYEVADGSLFASVVRRSDYIAANSLINGARAMSFVAGPSVGRCSFST